MKRWLIAIIVVCIPSAMLYFFGATETGLQVIWRYANRSLPAHIQVGELHGTLFSQIHVRDLRYQDEANQVVIEKLDLDWYGWKLLRKQIAIKNIQLENVNVTIRGAQNDSGATFDLTQLTPWLKHITLKQAEFNHVAINVANTTVTLQGSLHDVWDMQWAISALNLQSILPDTKGILIANGGISGKRYQPIISTDFALREFASGLVKIKSLSGHLAGNWQQRFSDLGQIKVVALQIGDFLIPDFTLTTKTAWQHTELRVLADALFSKQNQIHFELVLPEINLAKGLAQNFHALATANVQQFSQFNTLFKDVPEVRSWQGRVTGQFKATGVLTQPLIDGGLDANAGSVFIPAANITLNNIKLSTRYHTGRPVDLRGSCAVAGKGQLNVSGTYDIESASLPLNILIQSDRLLVKDSKEYKVMISPRLMLQYKDNDLNIDGRVDVPYAHISPIELSGTATLPSDVIIVTPNATMSVPTNLSLHIELVLGDHVKIQYRGLKTYLRGSIQMMSEYGNPITATGEFRIAGDGTYRAFGKSLLIQEGRLIYTGNLLTNPGLSIRASQTINRVGYNGGSQFNNSEIKAVYTGSDKLTVGVMVTGVLDKPVVTVYSEPAGLSQADIMSYLLFGYPQSQASGASSLALLNVATEMYGGPQKTNVVDKLQSKLGLDELSVGSTEYYDVGKNLSQNATTVNVGRSLGKKLSLHYSVGLFQQVQVFSLRYQINKHLAVQTETSNLESGGDLLYQIESRD